MLERERGLEVEQPGLQLALHGPCWLWDAGAHAQRTRGRPLVAKGGPWLTGSEGTGSSGLEWQGRILPTTWMALEVVSSQPPGRKAALATARVQPGETRVGLRTRRAVK